MSRSRMLALVSILRRSLTGRRHAPVATHQCNLHQVLEYLEGRVITHPAKGPRRMAVNFAQLPELLGKTDPS
jgi:hypothetical protein